MSDSRNQSPAPFFVATAIPYVNAPPHLGHALLFTYGDVAARYYRSLGREVVFSIGTDEHGGKIAEKAAELGLEPQALTDRMSEKFKQAAVRLEISQTHFIRTTDADHCRRVQLAWQKLEPYIYKGQYEGWYCQGCEAYKTETNYKETKGVCPDHNRAYELLKEENYLFKLSAFTEILKQKIDDGQLRIVPQSAQAEVLGMLKQGLIDISVARPRTSLKWGIGVPGDEEQVIYVWFDALLNYITVLGYPDGRQFLSHWPANLQIIGRDILRQHAVLWPAMLLGLGLPLYETLYVHGLVTVDGQKMSKTLGNSVDPLDLVEAYGLEAFRYFFLRHLPAYDNGDYSLERFIDAYNNELVDQLGNLLHRLQTLISQKLEGQLPRQAAVAFKQEDMAAAHDQAMRECRFNQALGGLFAEIKYLNQYLETHQPWRMEDQKEIAAVLDQAAANLCRLARFLEPFLPALSRTIVKTLTAEPVAAPGRPPLQKIEKPS